MRRLFAALSLIIYCHAVAGDLIEFNDGDVIKAEDFNHNFEELETDIANIPAGPAGPPGADGLPGVAAGLACDTNQIIKWDGSSEAWVCANLSGPQLETVYVDCTEGFATPDTCRAICPDGKQLVSGGCVFNYLNQAIYLMSIPEGTSWSCDIGDGGAGSHVDSAYAICQ